MFALPFNHRDNIFSYTEELEERIDEDDSATCFVNMYGDGKVEIGTVVNGSTDLPTDDFWIKPNNFNYADDYEVVATLTGSTSGPTGTSSFLTSGSLLTWNISGTSSGEIDIRGTVTIQIRRKGTTTVLGTIFADMEIRD